MKYRIVDDSGGVEIEADGYNIDPFGVHFYTRGPDVATVVASFARWSRIIIPDEVFEPGLRG